MPQRVADPRARVRSGPLLAWLRGLRLGSKLLLFTGALTTTVLLSTFAALSFQIRRETRTTFAAELGRNQAALRDLQDADRRELLWLSGFVTETPTLKAAVETLRLEAPSGEADASGLVGTIRREVEKIAAFVEADLLVVTDDLGQVLAAHPDDGGLARGDDLSPIPAVAHALDPYAPIDDRNFAIVTVGGDRYQAGAVPILLQGFSVGALILGHDLDAAYLEELRAALGSEVAVSSSEGLLLSTFAEREAALVEHLPARPMEEGGGGATVTVAGEEYLVAHLPLGLDESGAPVTLSLMRSLTGALAGPNRILFWNFAFFTGLAILLSVGGAATLSGSLLRPLNAFVAYVRRVHDSGDLTLRFDDARSPPDVRELTGTYHELMSSLSETYDDLRHSLERAEASSRAKTEFVANMSHEVRTPLNAIQGTTELLLETELSDFQREYAGLTLRSTHALLGIINDILDFSKIEAGQLDLESIPFDLPGVVQDVADLFAARAEEKGVALAVDFEEGTPEHVVGDPSRIRQVLTNLVGNAVKFTQDGTVGVSVVGREQGGSAELRFMVRDTGIGIPAHQVESIFEKFHQADTSMTRRFGGTGLGLAIAKQLVELMGGTMGVNSREGEGSAFWFSLQLDLGEPAAVQEMPAPPLAEARILVALEGAPAGERLAEALRGAGGHVRRVADGDEALRLLRRATDSGRPFRFAVLDQRLADMEADALGRVIRHDPALRGTDLVVLSSSARIGDARRFREAGFRAYLPRAVSGAALVDVLRRILGAGDDGSEPLFFTRHSLREGGLENLVEPTHDEGAAAQLAERSMRSPPSEGARAADGPCEPRAAADAPVVHNGARPSGAADQAVDRDAGEKGSGPRILMVDDDPMNREVIGSMLRLIGCEVDEACNGEEAVAAFDPERHQLVFMDCQMPVMDGYQATAEIRRRHGDRMSAPIVALTAHAMQEDRAKCLAAGMDHYMVKPVRIADFREAIARWVPDESAREHGPAAVARG